MYLDSFTMMNATYAKQPFSSKTISEVLSYFSVRCNVKYPMKSKFQSEWHKFWEFTHLLKDVIPIPTPLISINVEIDLFSA